MSFKIQDGIEFKTKQEWRDYMVATYYSFHDAHNAELPLVKLPDSVGGQIFDIANCSNCDLVVLDWCDEIHIDNLVDCKVFIGASAGSIFIRKCENSIFYTCSKQLRISNCNKCVHSVYSMSEVHIELCNDLEFMCFNGGYPQHESHLRAAKLLPLNNLWSHIYDHSEINNARKNWKYLDSNNILEPWFPTGNKTQHIPFVASTTDFNVTSTKSFDTHQVGESFGIEQMIADSKNFAKRQSDNPTSHANRASVALSSKSTVGHSSSDSDARSNTNTISTPTTLHKANNNSHTIEELGIEIALLVASARGKGIDLSSWLCDDIMTESNFNDRFISLGLTVSINEDWDTKREIDYATSRKSLLSIAEVCVMGTNKQGEILIDIKKFLHICDKTVQAFMRKMSEEVVALPDALVTPPKVESKLDSPTELVVEEPQEMDAIAVDVSHAVDCESEYVSMHESPPPNHVKNSPVIAPYADEIHIKEGGLTPESALEELLMDTLKQTDLYHLIQVHLGFIDLYAINPARGKIVVSSPRQWITLNELQDALGAGFLHLSTSHICMIFTLVRKFALSVSENKNNTNMSHGKEEALRSSAESLIPRVLVSSLDHNDLATSNTFSNLPDAATITGNIIHNNKLYSEWLKRYFVYLRLGKKTRPWEVWLSEKMKDGIFKKKSDKSLSLEFKKSLAGMSHTLSDDDINLVLLKKFEILPEEVLTQLIDIKIDQWVLDVNGRRDFLHQLHVKSSAEVGKLSSPASGAKRKVSNEEKLLKRQELKSKLIEKKRKEILISEQKEFTLTKEIYWKFDSDCKLLNYSGCAKFGEWLNRHLESELKQLSAFRQNISQNNHEVSERACMMKWYAPLYKLEHMIEETLKSEVRSAEFRKQLKVKQIRMRKDNLPYQQGDTIPLITRREFQQYFDNAFYASMQIWLQKSNASNMSANKEKVEMNPNHDSDAENENENGSENGMQERENGGRGGGKGRGTISVRDGDRNDGVFYESHDRALEIGILYHQEMQQEKDDRYAEWKEEKKKHLQRVEDLKKQEIEKKNIEDKKKAQKAKKAFKKWVKLHDKNMYFSKGEGKKREIPELTKAEHSTSWIMENF